MKKFFVTLIILIFNINIFSVCANDTDIISEKDLYINKLKISKDILDKSYKGKKYINIINKFSEKNKQNEQELIKISTKITPLLVSGKIKNQETLNIIKYMDAVINLALINIHENSSLKNTDANKSNTTLSIMVIDDKRCTNCPTDEILNQLNQLPSFSKAKIERKDFSDKGVEEYLKENKVTRLPLIAFSTNNFDVSADPIQNDSYGQPMPTVNKFLNKLPGGEFILEIGATYDPFIKRSANGFLILDKAKLEAIKKDSYIKGDSKAKITWLEYSDLECPYCTKLHNSGTEKELFTKYDTKLNIVYNHFPLVFHNNAQSGAEILECLAEQKGSDAFYELMTKSYTDENSTKEFLIDEAVKLGAKKDLLDKCVTSGKYTQKVNNQLKVGTELLGITGTPGNVLINNETGEYEIISGAYPTTEFVKIIDKLLK